MSLTKTLTKTSAKTKENNNLQTETVITIDEKIKKLRELMSEKNLDAYIINGTDPHSSEYVCPRWQTRQYISGFTGSAGIVVITLKEALIWADSRYFIQCEEQIKGTEFKMKRINGLNAEKISDFLKSLGSSAKIGTSADTITVKKINEYKTSGINVIPMEDLLYNIWTDRPEIPAGAVLKLTDKLCGESVSSKISRIRNKMTESGASCTLISSLDDIAWILNLRGYDIKYCPLFIAYLFIDNKESILFTDKNRFRKIKTDNLPYKIKNYDDVYKKLSGLKKSSIYLNPDKTNMSLLDFINTEDVKIIYGNDFSEEFKACKNSIEIEGMVEAHIQDGASIVNFLSELYSEPDGYTELSVAALLQKHRECSIYYLGPSFGTISAYKEHGAIVHYNADKNSDKTITGNGLLILDSGGHSRMGTTDITMTLPFGKPTNEQKKDYTLVLKGHLALSALIFPEGTNGYQLDAVAHRFLWQNGLDYFHGTGHGVGCRLNVHEGPQRISSHISATNTALKPGMVISNEPGVYKEGKHGIRIENLIYVTEAFKTEFGKFLKFNTLTCCPYEKKLIVKEMLTEQEIKQINNYHTWVYKTLKDIVDKNALKYLKEATLPL